MQNMPQLQLWTQQTAIFPVSLKVVAGRAPWKAQKPNSTLIGWSVSEISLRLCLKTMAMEGRSAGSVVALPFKVAAAFLFLIFFWGFVGEEMSMSNPVSYEYEHTKKEHNVNNNHSSNDIHSESHGSYMPWRHHARDRHIHLDTTHIRVGERVELVGLTSRADLNGVTGR
jgi:hypothetical protein